MKHEPRLSQRAVDSLLAGLEAAPGTRLSLETLRGGLHTAAYLITLDPAHAGIPPLVLRLYPGYPEDEGLCANEVASLRALEDTPVPTPKLRWCDPSGALFGAPAVAIEHVAGSQPTALTADVYQEIGRALALLHGHSPPSDLARSLLVRPSNSSDGLQRRAHREWPRLMTEPRVFLHGDACAANTRFRDGHLAALIDWSNARPGPPSLDMAAVLLDAELFGDSGASEAALIAYQRAGGVELPGLQGALAAYAKFAAQRLVTWSSSLRDVGVPVDDSIVEERYVDLCKRLESGIACDPRM